VHGSQEERFFHCHYGHYCLLPRYIFCEEHLPVARLRPSNIDASAGTVQELAPIIHQIWQRWQRTQIVLRADSDFAREEIMARCEEQGVDYVFGLAKSSRLIRKIARELKQDRKRHLRTGKPARFFLPEFSTLAWSPWRGSLRCHGGFSTSFPSVSCQLSRW
jgi:hypothetical protein